MGFENFNDPEPPEETVVVPEESSNRTFLIVAAALGGIALLALICIGAYALVFLPRMRDAQTQQRATLEAQDTEVAMIIEGTSTAAEMTAIVAAYTATPTRTPVPPTFTPTPSPTPVVAQGSPGAPGVSPDEATATMLYATLHANSTAVVQTLAVASPTPTPTRLAATGFADDIGLPAMMGMAALLIVVIFLARKLRTA